VITELRVRDLATIDDVTLALGEGLNVLTGETGAGKSMLVDALGLLLGGRAESGLVRPGATKTIVEGALEVKGAALRRLEEIGLDADEPRVVVRREVSVEGRSRAWVNGSPTTNAVLADLGALLVDLAWPARDRIAHARRRAARHPRRLRRCRRRPCRRGRGTWDCEPAAA
jgi:DNA repair protein RecN (Recombination protein N)